MENKLDIMENKEKLDRYKKAYYNVRSNIYEIAYNIMLMECSCDDTDIQPVKELCDICKLKKKIKRLEKENFW